MTEDEQQEKLAWELLEYAKHMADVLDSEEAKAKENKVLPQVYFSAILINVCLKLMNTHDEDFILSLCGKCYKIAVSVRKMYEENKDRHD